MAAAASPPERLVPGEHLPVRACRSGVRRGRGARFHRHARFSSTTCSGKKPRRFLQRFDQLRSIAQKHKIRVIATILLELEPVAETWRPHLDPPTWRDRVERPCKLESPTDVPPREGAPLVQGST